jgi:hypothetical protein
METEKKRHGNMEKWRYGDMKTSNRKRKMKAQSDFLNPFTVCSSCKQKFVVCPFVDEETNTSYPFANGFAHLC